LGKPVWKLLIYFWKMLLQWAVIHRKLQQTQKSLILTFVPPSTLKNVPNSKQKFFREITALNAVLAASKSVLGMTVQTVRIPYGWDSSPLSRFSCPEKSALKTVLLAAVPALENSAAPLSKTVQMLYGLSALVNVPINSAVRIFQPWEVCSLAVRTCCAAFAALPLLRNHSSAPSPPLSICSWKNEWPFPPFPPLT